MTFVMMIKRTILVLLFATTALGQTLYAQKFTKKEQARREAREAYYFCGASFTFTAGYVHSWMSNNAIELGTNNYGKSERWGNTNNSFNLGFLWDQAINQKWGLQTGAFYSRKGGDHLHYFDNGLGYGKILRDEETEEVTSQCVEAQVQARYFINLAKKFRMTLNGGIYLDKYISSPSGFLNWNMGPQVGLGIDWQHFSAQVTYQPGLFERVAEDSHTRQSAVSVNFGYRLWKK